MPEEGRAGKGVLGKGVDGGVKWCLLTSKERMMNIRRGDTKSLLAGKGGERQAHGVAGAF